MNKLLPTVLCAAALFGCRTHEVTPDESWSDYGRYYTATGETTAAPTGPADVRMVKSKEVPATLEALKKEGYVELGSFKIDDDTDITRAAVQALAQKVQAGVVVWTPVVTSSRTSAMPNPDLGIPGVDITQAPNMNARRPDESFAEQTKQTHTIHMFGKKK